MQTDPYNVNIRDDSGPWTPRPTLGGDDYRSLEVYEQECEKIWWGEFLPVNDK